MSTLESPIRARRRETDSATVVGACPAGLACASALARADRRVVVREWHRDVGARFHGNFQGIENWSDELKATALTQDLLLNSVMADSASAGSKP